MIIYRKDSDRQDNARRYLPQVYWRIADFAWPN
jgi:hypothetical protein